MRFHKILSLVLMLALLASCHPYKTLTAQRAIKAKEAKGDIKIGVVWPSSVLRDDFFDGINLAAEEINLKGGVMGRKIKLISYDGKAFFSETMGHARSLSRNTDIVAVIGHDDSSSAIPASVVYQHSGLLFISPRATNPVLTEHGFDMVFRIMPSDNEIGIKLAELAYQIGYRRMAVIDDQSTYGIKLANIFYDRANDLGIEITYRRYYFPWEQTVKPLLAEIKHKSMDAIFLAADEPSDSLFIREARLMGIHVPFMCGDALDSPLVWNLVGADSEGTIVPTVYNPFSSDPGTRSFIVRFHQKYGRDPDTSAALGYDALNLLAFAFEASRSTVPMVVASHLKFVQDWHGVTSPYTFNNSGDLVDKKLFFKMMHGGRFQFLPEDYKTQ